MVEKIAYRVSASILLLTGLAIVAMLVMGLTRADAGSSSGRAAEAVADSAERPWRMSPWPRRLRRNRWKLLINSR